MGVACLYLVNLPPPEAQVKTYLRLESSLARNCH